MRISVISFAALCLLFPAVARAAPAPQAKGSPKGLGAVPEEYLVTIHDAPSDAGEKILEAIGRERGNGHGIKSQYKFGSVGVWHVKSHPRLQEMLEKVGISATVEPNTLIPVPEYTETSPVPEYTETSESLEANSTLYKRQTYLADHWGRQAISNSPDSNYRRPTNSGSGARIYIIDSGVGTHPDLSGRVIKRYKHPAVQATSPDKPHGSQAAGIAAGATTGAAPSAGIVDCWIFSDADLSVPASRTIDAINWAINDVTATWPTASARRAVINISMGGPGFNSVYNAAVNAAVAANIYVVVAAGNDGANACNYSPAGFANVITVGAATKTNRNVASSNHGSCLDMWAPGENVRTIRSGAVIGSTDGYGYVSATSFAAPYVSGVMALILSHHTFASVTEGRNYLFNTAAPNSPIAMSFVQSSSGVSASSISSSTTTRYVWNARVTSCTTTSCSIIAK